MINAKAVTTRHFGSLVSPFLLAKNNQSTLEIINGTIIAAIAYRADENDHHSCESKAGFMPRPTMLTNQICIGKIANKQTHGQKTNVSRGKRCLTGCFSLWILRRIHQQPTQPKKVARQPSPTNTGVVFF